MRMLAFGTYDVTKHPRVGVLIEGLRENGVDVVDVNEPLGLSTADRVEMARRPWLAYRLLLRLVRRWIALIHRSRGVGCVDSVLVGYLGQFDVLLARVLFPGRKIILDMLIFGADTARDRGVTSRRILAFLNAIDRLAIKAADVVVVDTDESATLVPPRQRHKAVVVPVGASHEWFQARQEPRVPGGDLRVVFFGLYTPLQGAVVIGESLARLRDRVDIAVTMIGNGQDLTAAQAAAAGCDVKWLDWVDARELPHVVAGHDVCLGIFGTTPKALRVVPNKVFQGAAAGCAIVTSDTPVQRRTLGESAIYVQPGDPDQLADALLTLAGDPERCRSLQLQARVAAAHFGPDFLADTFLANLHRCGTGENADMVQPETQHG